jgi:prepilin-type processing-associated H-X9-DG protein
MAGPDVPVACGDYAAASQLHPELVRSGLIAPPANAQGILTLHSRIRLTDIWDGTSTTLILTEAAGRPAHWRLGRPLGDRSHGGGWADPRNGLVILGSHPDGSPGPGLCAVNCSNDEIYSFHPGGANAVFADGSVRLLSRSISLTTVAALVTYSGGEVVVGPEF